MSLRHTLTIEHASGRGPVMPMFVLKLSPVTAKHFAYAPGRADMEERARARAEGFKEGWEMALGYAEHA